MFRHALFSLALIALIALLPAACQPAGPSPEPTPTPAAEPAPLSPDAPLWREAGLTAQPRLEALRRGAAEYGYEPGSTPWRPADLDLPTALRSPGAATEATPGALLVAVAAHLGLGDPLGTELWELTSRVWMEGEDLATGVVLGWGMMDDSVAGHDLRVTMRRGERGWHVERMEERFHCARGVTGEGLCA